MIITYLHNHGWRHTAAAFGNFLLWLGVVLQLGGLMAMGASRDVYSQVSGQLGFHEETLMGSGFLHILLGPVGFWTLATLAVLTLAKEFVRLSMQRRLLINAMLFIVAIGLSTYVITLLYFLPIQSAG